MPATDRDLLVVEPLLFRDVGFAASTLARGTGSITAGVLTISGINLPSLGVTTGHVAIVDGVPLEVLAPSGSGVTVSLLRLSSSASPITPGNQASKPASVASFGPQIRLAHNRLLQSLGLDDATAQAMNGPNEAAITNPEALTLAGTLAALAFIWAAADSERARLRADQYDRRARDEAQRVRVLIDLDADGLPEAARTVNSARLIRA